MAVRGALLAHQFLSEATSDDENVEMDPSSRQPPSKWTLFKQHPAVLFMLSWWRVIVILSPPILLLPLPILWKGHESKALYTILIMAVYWVTEVVPIAVTSLLPLILFPALGVLPADATARNYLKDSNMLFVGGLMMAVAIEKWNLHKRMALLVLLLVGSKPKWLLLGFMGTTCFLSMWISNTATAAMMLPIAQAVLLEVKEESKLESTSPLVGNDAVTSVRYTRRYNSIHENKNGEESQLVEEEEKEEVEESVSITEPELANGVRISPSDGTGQDGEQRATEVRMDNKRFNRLAKSLMLGVAYSANIGGTGTLTGTGPNIVLAGLAENLGVNFGLWFAFAAPAMLLALLLSWLYLSAIYCDDSFQSLKKLLFKREKYYFDVKKTKAIIREQYKKLGRIRYAEVLLLVMFLLLVLLWLFREPRFIKGWGIIFSNPNYFSEPVTYVTDSTAVLTIVFLLFLIPSEPCYCSWGKVLKAGSSPRLLDWDTVQRKLPWGIIILLGSGFAIAEGAEESGLSEWIGSKLTLFESLPREVIAFSMSILVASLTEVISNVATATLFLPILKALGTSLCIHPLYLMIPATVSASYAFMVPVATPPNAIAFSYGYIKVYNMVATGFLMNIMCVLIVTLALNTLGVPIFGLNHFPTELAINGTSCFNTTGAS